MKYLKSVLKKRQILRHNGVFSYTLSCATFDCEKLLIEEVKRFCEEQGHTVQKISYFSSGMYDIAVPKVRVKAHTDVNLVIFCNEDGSKEACAISHTQLEVDN